MSIHSTSIIDKSAKLGANVSIGPYCVIGPDVVIGDNSQLHSHVVMEYARLGPNSNIYPFVSIGLPPQHIQYKGEPSHVEMGSGCTIRESVTIHRGSPFGHNKTIIGNNAFFMALSHIAHDCIIGNDVILANGAQIAGHVEVGDKAFISTTVGIHQWVRIGSMAIISGGAMVPMDVAPFASVQGDRAHIIGLNSVGMRRGGISRESRSRIKKAYQELFYSGQSLNDALQSPALNEKDPHIDGLREFLKGAKRGVLRPRENQQSSGEGENE
jgi:UDP-N-acetylglucosamine acyltransferase